MTMVQLPAPIPLWDITSNSVTMSVASSGFVIDAASEKAGLIMQAPKTGSVDKIGFYVGAHTTGATLDARVETVSATTGMPSGTLFGTNTSGTVATTATGWYEVTLTAAANVTIGDNLALVVAQPSSSPGNCAIGDLVNYFGQSSSNGLPYGANFVSSWAVASTYRRPLIFLGYDDSTYGFCPLNMPVTAVNAAYTFNSTSTPDEVGNRFNALVPMRIVGARAYINPAADSRDYTLKFYDNAGTLLASRTIDTAIASGGTYLWFDLLFTAPVDISAGVHRMTILPTTASNIGTGHLTISSATGARYAMPGGVDTYWTERTDAGSFSDTNTRLHLLTPLVQGFDDAAGGGGGLAANPIRGFVA